MQLRPEAYRSTKANVIADAATRTAFMDLAQKLEALALAASRADSFPSGAIVFWLGAESDIPDGWSVATELQSRFPRGMASVGTPGATGGSDTHTHTVAVNTNRVTIQNGSGVNVSLADGAHAHNLSSTTTLPPYVDGIWIRKD